MDDGRRAILLEEELAGWRWSRGYVRNVAVAVAMAAVDERAAGRIYNVGEPALTMLEWVEGIAQAAGWKGEIVLMPSKRLPESLRSGINFAQHLVADTRRIRSDLGYEEPVPLKEALAQSVAWERAHPPASACFDYEAEDAVLGGNALS